MAHSFGVCKNLHWCSVLAGHYITSHWYYGCVLGHFWWMNVLTFHMVTEVDFNTFRMHCNYIWKHSDPFQLFLHFVMLQPHVKAKSLFFFHINLDSISCNENVKTVCDVTAFHTWMWRFCPCCALHVFVLLGVESSQYEVLRALDQVFIKDISLVCFVQLTLNLHQSLYPCGWKRPQQNDAVSTMLHHWDGVDQLMRDVVIPTDIKLTNETQQFSSNILDWEYC